MSAFDPEQLNTSPDAPGQVVDRFIGANFAFPQMLGAHIVRMGNMATSMMLDGQLNPRTFGHSRLSQAQVAMVNERAQTAHNTLAMSVPHSSEDHLDYAIEGFVTPFVLRNLYERSKQGVLAAMASFSIIAGGIISDSPTYRTDEAVFYCEQLLAPEHRQAATLLGTIWQAADEVLAGPAVKETIGALHGSLRLIRNEMSREERRDHLGATLSAARASLSALISKKLEPLIPTATAVLGNEQDGRDVIELFPVWTVYEGDDSHLE